MVLLPSLLLAVAVAVAVVLLGLSLCVWWHVDADPGHSFPWTLAFCHQTI